MNRPIPNGPWHQRPGTLSDLPGLSLGAQDPRRMAWCTTGAGPQGQREGQADAGGGGQAYGQPRRADLSVVLGDGRLAVPVVVKSAEPGPVRAGCVAYGLEGVLGERAGLHDDRAVVFRVEVDQVDDGGLRVGAGDQGGHRGGQAKSAAKEADYPGRQGTAADASGSGISFVAKVPPQTWA